MRKQSKIYSCLLPAFAIAVCMIMLHSCKEDVFNAEKVKATYQDRFPVADIDPSMDWKMTRKVSVNVSVYEDTDADYTIRIYDANPLTAESSAKLLAEGVASTTQSFVTTLDCANTLTEVYVCRIDAQSRNVVQYTSIENGAIQATFGNPPATATRSATTRSVSIETYSPDWSETELRSLLSTAEEITSATTFRSGGIYKVSKNRTYRGNISYWGINSYRPATIIIEGEWAPSYNMSVENGFEFYVISGGKISIPSSGTLTLKGFSRFIVYAGGTLKGNNIELTNASYGRYNYNAGTLEVNKFHASMQGAFYNNGTVRVSQMLFDSGCRFINQGKAYLGSTDSNIRVDNGCYLSAEEFIGTLNMGDNSSAEIETFGSRWNNYNTWVTLGENSMVTVTDVAELTQAKFIGPNNQYALVKINRIDDIASFHSFGNIYYEVNEIADRISADIWWESKFLEAIKNSKGSISKYGESPILIPAGDCTGNGNTPNGSGSPTPTEPMLYTYVFEDNFPKVGDYDFNDIVLNVEVYYNRQRKTNQIQSIELNVTLAATGATKPLGVGLRIIGLKASDIKKITPGREYGRFQSSFNDPKNLFRYDTSSRMEASSNHVVIPIAGEVHNVFGVELGDMVNTGNGVTANMRTYQLTIELTDPTQTVPLFSKENMDFFICYQYQNMQKRMEVHLYEFWKYGATDRGTVQQENLDLAGNNTWAICVPYGFRYPKEGVNISRTDDPFSSAYPEFIYWARDRNTYQNWYDHPVEYNIY